MGTINNFGNVLLPAGSSTIDVQSLLNSSIAAAQAPLKILQQEQTNVQIQAATMQNISGDMNSLATAVQTLTSSSGGVNSVAATSSNTAVLNASADPTAQSGTHSIVVNSLATSASYYSQAWSSADTLLGAGNFNLNVGSNPPVTITLTNANGTLNLLASDINAKNLGVTASVIHDANGYRLALVSSTTGTAGNFTVTNDSTDLGFTQAASGANASLTVDGVPISSASNTVTGVIPGVTLNLAGAAPAQTVSLGLSPDANQAATTVSQFVSAWNKVIGDINAQFNVSSDGSGGVLEADNNLRDMQNQLLSAITYSISGNGGLVNLASVGINMNNDGTLSLNSGTLQNALNSNFSGVQNLLQGASGVGAFLNNTLTQMTDPTQGVVELDLQGMSQTNQSLTQQISAMQALIATQTQNLTNQYAQMQTTLDEMPLLQSQMQQQLSALSNG